MIKQNLHTHSLYCDGKNKIEDIVIEAIERGFDILGFSGHGYNRPIDDYSMTLENTELYYSDLKYVKQKYKDKIKIYVGIEEDSCGRYFKDKECLDYVIGSVHFINVNGKFEEVDLSKEVTDNIIKNGFNGSFIEYAKAYYNEVKKVSKWSEVDIVGHIDLLMKFNDNEEYISFSDKEYLDIAYNCIDEIILNDKIIEVNTGAISRGYRTKPYPYVNLLKYINEKGGKICLNSDCHEKSNIDCYYNESMKIIKNCGFKNMMMLSDNGFLKKSIDEF